ncbi:MAG: DUF3631 domain-containing protein, partial [bacterium]|nr:DUF3631 domain-containing protein [bacterium]
RMSSEQIVAVLTKMEDRPWPEWRRGQPLTQSGLARLLKRYDIRPRTIRMGSDTAKGYLLSDFTDAFRRYLPSEPSHRNKLEKSSNSGDSQPSQDHACYGSESDEKAQNDGLVTAVTAGDGETDAEDPESDPEEEFEL